ncbi:MAG TPA: PEP-CTERM sorting domain-containing protein [Phycisphaerae bacterium]|nr:PEP-CTERM sorting domain-containing protein [Phycisphaerae bacterium]
MRQSGTRICGRTAESLWGPLLALIWAASPALAGTVADAKLAGPGVEVTLDNVVISSTTDLIAATTAKNFHVQDATGGLCAFGPNFPIDQLLAEAGEGDSISITGTTTSWQGLFEFSLFDGPASLINNGYVGTPLAIPITPGDIQDYSATAEALENMLATLTDVTFVDAGGVFAGATDYMVTDGVHNGWIRISTYEQDIVGTTIPAGSVDITGLVSQWDDNNPPPGQPGVGYLLTPRDLTDIVPEPATLWLLALCAMALTRRVR